MKLKNLVKAIMFVIVFILLFSLVTVPFVIPAYPVQHMDYKWMAGIYDEPEGTLDAVYIGSSNTYAFWNQNIAWKEYGITVYPYACSEAPLVAAEFMLKEAHRTHPDSLYIVNINTLGDTSLNDVSIHRLVDYVPLSRNKHDMITRLCDIADIPAKERMEYYFPLIKYHTSWDNLSEYSYDTDTTYMKAGDTYEWFLEMNTDLTALYKTSDGEAQISETIRESLEGILAYCDKESLNVLFVTAPRAEKDIQYVEQLNTINKIIKERGYRTLDLLNSVDETGLDLSKDYYNTTHTNIHGSIKYTEYMAEYLIDNYGFEDKRGNDEYSSWDEACELYCNAVASFALSLELNVEKRDPGLSDPENLTVAFDGNNVKLSWSEVEGADGYLICRRKNYSHWHDVSFTDETSFADSDEDPTLFYVYAVVPYYIVDGDKVYGDYIYNGIKPAV